MSNPHNRFLWALTGCFGATLLPIFIFNFVSISNTIGNYQLILLASQWQQQTHGITFAGGLGAPDSHLLFKVLRLNDRLPEINTVVLGSSTVMGITQKAFPEPYRIYNMAINNMSTVADNYNPLSISIGEAEFIQEHHRNIKWFVIPLDWSLGFIYWDFPPLSMSQFMLEPMQVAKSDSAMVSATDIMSEAISYPRIANLFKSIKAVFLANNKWDSLHKNFSQIGSDYICPDGSPGKDFDPMYRGTCTGFRFDGSATFANNERVGKNAPFEIRASLDPDRMYSKSLMFTNGVPSQALLKRLVDIDRHAKQNNGGVIFLRPPMLPGVEDEFMQHPQLAEALFNTKKILDEWVRQNHLSLINAGRSDLFGCGIDEFVDAHHAVDSCYKKVFESYFSPLPKA